MCVVGTRVMEARHPCSYRADIAFVLISTNFERSGFRHAQVKHRKMSARVCVCVGRRYMFEYKMLGVAPIRYLASQRCCRPVLVFRDHRCYCNITTAAAVYAVAVQYSCFETTAAAATVTSPLLPPTHHCCCCYLPPTVTQLNNTGMLN